MRERRYRWYLIGILAVILALTQTDGVVLGLVLQQVKVDLGLSDTALGLLSGIAFALFYAVMGIPIARWADRGNRARIIAITTALWSVMIALCGAAQSFAQLLLIRVGVAVGESGCVPASLSLISDYFSRAERPRAVARFYLGGSLSLVMGYFVGGWLNQLYGWRVTFMLLGLPGVILAGLAAFALKEPRSAALARRNNPPRQSRAGPANLEQPSLWSVCAILWRNRTFRYLWICATSINFFAAGINAWQVSFFIRSFHLATGELGVDLTVVLGISCLVGGYWGGEWVNRYARNNEPLQLKSMAIMVCIFAVLSPFTYVVTNKYGAFALVGLGAMSIMTINGPQYALLQTLLDERMRAVSMAIVYLTCNLFGVGFGPLLVGILSDALRPHFGVESLRYALLLLYPGYLWSSWLLWRASRTVTSDLPIVSQQLSGSPDWNSQKIQSISHGMTLL